MKKGGDLHLRPLTHVLRLLFLAGLGKSKVMRTFQTVGLLVVLSVLPTTIPAQERSISAPATVSTGTYANTTEGLKQLLLDMRTTAQEGNDDKLAAFVRDMEIPNCDAWLHRMYDSDKADSWKGLCEAKSRDNHSIFIGQVGYRPASLRSQRLTQSAISYS
jgi:hypothetical protein